MTSLTFSSFSSSSASSSSSSSSSSSFVLFCILLVASFYFLGNVARHLDTAAASPDGSRCRLPHASALTSGRGALFRFPFPLPARPTRNNFIKRATALFQASSAPSTPSVDEQLPLAPEVTRVLPASGSMSASRSRLVQELLEQNSAILHKMKDRSSSVHSYPEEEVQEAGTGGASEQAAAFRHPFPRHINKTPKDAVVKLGLYHSPQKY